MKQMKFGIDKKQERAFFEELASRSDGQLRQDALTRGLLFAVLLTVIELFAIKDKTWTTLLVRVIVAILVFSVVAYIFNRIERKTAIRRLEQMDDR